MCALVTGVQTCSLPIYAHIRLANPRTPGSEENLILRRPFNYSNGVTRSGQLEQGLLLIAYQADLEKGFIAVPNRLSGEPLEESSEVRRVGKACVSKCRSRWSPLY